MSANTSTCVTPWLFHRSQTKFVDASELVSVWPDKKFKTTLSASCRIGSPSRQYLPMSYASQRGNPDGLTPTRSTSTEEDFSESSRLTDIVYLPIGPGLPGLQELQPAYTAINMTAAPAATNRVTSRFFIVPTLVLVLSRNYKTHFQGQSYSSSHNCLFPSFGHAVRRVGPVGCVGQCARI